MTEIFSFLLTTKIVTLKFILLLNHQQNNQNMTKYELKIMASS